MVAPRRVVPGLGWAVLVLAAVIGSVIVVLSTVGDGQADPRPAVPSPPDAALGRDVRSSAVLVAAQGCRIESQGMGVAIGAGLFVTNAHVVAGSTAVELTTDTGEVHRGDVVAFDPLRDIAVVEAPTLGLAALALGEPRSGSQTLVLARGIDPVGDPVIEVLNGEVVRTINIFISDIYGDGRYERRGLELSVDIGPGDSGGGVVDGTGSLVGVIFSSSRGQDDVAYAVSAVEVAAFAEARSDRPVDTGVCRR